MVLCVHCNMLLWQQSVWCFPLLDAWHVLPQIPHPAMNPLNNLRPSIRSRIRPNNIRYCLCVCAPQNFFFFNLIIFIYLFPSNRQRVHFSKTRNWSFLSIVLHNEHLSKDVSSIIDCFTPPPRGYKIKLQKTKNNFKMTTFFVPREIRL